MQKHRTIAEGRWLGLYERDNWEFAARPNADGVVGVLAITEDDEIVLVEQFRRPMQASVIEIPAGLVGDEEAFRGEEGVETARRELLEETGFEAARVEEIYAGPTSAGMTSEITRLYHARGLTRRHEGGGVGGEQITVHLVPRSELPAWLKRKGTEGFQVDFKIFAALWLADVRDLQ